MAATLLHVSSDLPLWLDDGAGRRFEIPSGEGFTRVPVAVYRRWRWTGHLHRPLARVRGFGRTYLLDVHWARAQKVRVPESAVATRRGCGCRKAS